MSELISSIELPESALQVLGFLTKNGPTPPRDISRKAGIPLRTVSYALRTLLIKKFCHKVPNLGDMRRPLYIADQEKSRAVFMKYGSFMV
ncbi:MAG: MarR family transcriptional regulator [Candidatus Thorarchaeota archaeon]